MSRYKLLHWTDDDNCPEGQSKCEIVLLNGYLELTIPNCRRLLAEMQQMFPFITEEDVRFGKVYKSTWCKNYMVAQWYGCIEKREYLGYMDAGNWQKEPTPPFCQYWWA